MSQGKRITYWIAAFVFVAAWMWLCAVMDEKRMMGDERHNRDWVAQQVCGQNSSAEWIDDKTIQCFTKKGRKTGKQVAI